MISILSRVLRETPEFLYNLFIQHAGTDSMIGDIMEKETPVEEKLTEKDCSCGAVFFHAGSRFRRLPNRINCYIMRIRLRETEDKTEDRRRIQ